MRVIQTRNDTIRLIFNPKTDGLCLSDFLIVRDGKDNFLAQIIEIYDDKFNQEENVANIKLIYRILPDYQVVPYDNFTPSRECEIAKIKSEEIEKCLNMDKITVPFGISTKNNRTVDVSLDFFNNNPVVFADKLDEVNLAFENIAQKLKTHKKVIAIDYTGNLNIKNAKRIIARSDFKLPLDYYSLDYIWEKALREASPEASSELEDMFIELKKFVDSTEDKYIPFPRFIKVIEQQYKATPAPELHLLLTRLKRYLNEGLFSRSKKEFQAVSKAMQKENAIIIDFSGLKFEWHKEFLEFVVRQIRDYDAYLLLRLNENNSNPELINDLYLKNPKLNIISSISYGFAKMPQVMEFAKNYILYKTLNPRRDFGFANFQIAALNSASFLIFGEDTMDFMFTLKNYIYDETDNKKIEDKKIYIDLNLELEEMTPVELAEGNFDLKNVHIQNGQKRLADEVAIDDILPGYEQNQKERLNEIKHTNEYLKEHSENTQEETKEPEEDFNEEDRNEDASYDLIEVETETEPDIEIEPETEPDIQEVPENIDDAESEAVIESENDESALDDKDDKPEIESEDIDTEATETKNEDLKEPDKKKEELSVVADDSKVAELIEASLKNDEAYIKEISDNKNDEIPLKEDELDYFVNPESAAEISEENSAEADKTNDTDEVITPEMINEAIDNEELSSEIEKGLEEKDTDNLLKKNLKNDEEKKDETSSSNIQEENKTVLKEEVKTVNPVAVEPEMIKKPLEETAEKEPEIAVIKETKTESKEKELTEESSKETVKEEPAKTPQDEAQTDKKEPKKETNTEEPEKESLESIKAEAHSVLEKESVQHALDAVSAPVQDDTKEVSADKPVMSSGDNLPQTPKKEDDKKEDIKNAEKEEPVAKARETSAPKEQIPTEKNKQDTPIIIVKEKPNLVIDDFSEDTKEETPDIKNEAEKNTENKPSSLNKQDEKEDISLKELAQKSIEARFDEVIAETSKPVQQKKNKLKINENISIDIDSIKKQDKSTQSALPIFKNNEEEETLEYDFKEGMKVSHEKYGSGHILKVVKYSNRCLLQIEFDETGKRLLDPKIAKIKPV